MLVPFTSPGSRDFEEMARGRHGRHAGWATRRAPGGSYLLSGGPETAVRQDQLQFALNSRVVIEQATGVIAERSGVSMATAFDTLRSAAGASRRPLTDVATDVTRGMKGL